VKASTSGYGGYGGYGYGLGPLFVSMVERLEKNKSPKVGPNSPETCGNFLTGSMDLRENLQATFTINMTVFLATDFSRE
jgi:hypothetical protein